MDKKCRAGGYLTVYLALVMTVMISLYMALIEGARVNAIRLEAECVTDIGLQSILAEYHRELFRQYNLFAVDISYGTSEASVANVEQHMQAYMDRNFSVNDIFLSEILYKDFLAMEAKNIKVTKMSFLTDYEGAVFRRRAEEAIKDDAGVLLMEELAEWLVVVENNELNVRNIEAEKEELDIQIDAYDGREIQISEMEKLVVDIENPMRVIDEIRSLGVLNNVIDKTNELSSKSIAGEKLISDRIKEETINVGNGSFEEPEVTEQLSERFWFQEYLLKYLHKYGDEEEKETALSYQVEYLISGKDLDVQNLKEVANLLCAMRGAANAVFLYSDEMRCAEAELLAAAVATMCFVPELTEVFKHSILLGWAYAESLYDVKSLLEGKKVPLLKEDDDWHYGLENILQFDNNESETSEEGAGLSYEDYLRILISFVDMNTLTDRAMDMVEADIRRTAGNEYFRIDACCDSVEFFIQIESLFGYQNTITRGKKY